MVKPTTTTSDGQDKFYKYYKNTGERQQSIGGSGDEYNKQRGGKFTVEVTEKPYEAIVNVYGLVDKNGVSSAARNEQSIMFDMKQNVYEMDEHGNKKTGTIIKVGPKAKGATDKIIVAEESVTDALRSGTTGKKVKIDDPVKNAIVKEAKLRQGMSAALIKVLDSKGFNNAEITSAKNDYKGYLTDYVVSVKELFTPLEKTEVENLSSTLQNAEGKELENLMRSFKFLDEDERAKIDDVKTKYIYDDKTKVFSTLNKEKLPEIRNKQNNPEGEGGWTPEEMEEDEAKVGKSSERKRRKVYKTKIAQKSKPKSKTKTNPVYRVAKKKQRFVNIATSPSKFSFGIVSANIKSPIMKTNNKNPMKTNRVKVSTPSIKGLSIGKFKIPKIKLWGD